MVKEQSGTSGDTGPGSLVTEQVKQGTQQAVQQTQEAAGQVSESAKKGAVSYADSQKQTATQSLHSVADALHETGDTLDSKGQAPIANYAKKAADKVEGLAGYLEETPVQGLIRDAENFARQHSTLFLGGAVALGLAAARFIKASAPSSPPPSQYGSGTVGSDNYGAVGAGKGSYGYGQGQLGGGTSYASGAPYSDVAMSSTPAILDRPSRTGIVDEVELADATVFNAELGTESSDGPAR